MTPPNTFDEWMKLSKERQADAKAMLEDRKESIGPVYMAGYAVETSLKALLRKKNKEFPKSGAEGHNLKNLWHESGFRLGDIKDKSGEKSFFISEWGTHLRYEISLPSAYDSATLVRAAGDLSSWIQKQIRRSKSKRGKL